MYVARQCRTAERKGILNNKIPDIFDSLHLVNLVPQH
jgi:hypothetical protein